MLQRARLDAQQGLPLRSLPHSWQQAQYRIGVRPYALRQAFYDLIEQTERLPSSTTPMSSGVAPQASRDMSMLYIC